MKRLQILIEEEMDDALARQAGQEHTSKGALIRRFVRAGIGAGPKLSDDPLWELVGIAQGSEQDSASVDEVVYSAEPEE